MKTETLTPEEVEQIEARLDRFLASLTFGEPERGNRYVESEDADYFEQGIDNEYDAYDLLRQFPALIRDWRALQQKIRICEDAFELDEAVKIPEVGNLNALQFRKTLDELQRQNAALREQLAQTQQHLRLMAPYLKGKRRQLKTLQFLNGEK